MEASAPPTAPPTAPPSQAASVRGSRLDSEMLDTKWMENNIMMIDDTIVGENQLGGDEAAVLAIKNLKMLSRVNSFSHILFLIVF